MNWLSNLLPGLDGISNIHPLLIHFPIVLLPIACLLHFLPKADGWSWTAPAARWSLWLGTASALVAVASGYLAADGLGHDSPGHDYVHVHRNFMIATGAIAVVTSVLVFALRNRSDRASRVLVGICLLGLSTVLMLGSDRGATLVYRYGMGVQQEQQNSDSHADAPPHSH